MAAVGALDYCRANTQLDVSVQQQNFMFCMITNSGATRPDGLVVMTFRLHRKGHRFDPGSGYFFYMRVQVHATRPWLLNRSTSSVGRLTLDVFDRRCDLRLFVLDMHEVERASQ